NLEKGAYVLSDSEGTPDIILIGTGSEVQLVMGAQEVLSKEGIKARVVSMPSWKLFDQQDQAYKDQVLPPQVPQRLAVEAGVTFGWYKYVTTQGDVLGLDRFGESGPAEDVFKLFGFTVENVCNKARAILERGKK
ncbi:MAG TPA: transketolase C-terminal domain-containing protein, partial [Flavisolibacter sp.]|nr:transketolase C-terminal domain-containing protein [Flavisolibacter sp.]